ncbi:putative dual-specificity RNA methyltransferase RlmN [Caldalkalibacillus thermarum]|uniref:23S rRNA (adenine(2503)-C(2))-methyltransferase RlmN n=1 Tax=Caldalkalibacillus thermarum TaxID=296745 RepID=UPI00166A348D|nr:23S rRNA (adenine(2503)-C(2))-methyltransferase RlmN [Caldalkalibacillus thermarum]GGK32218.1 putative dual-specificity RNA methyltransferase RlmN [Caldalkalibacillus thermarum]
MKHSIYGLTLEQLTAWLVERGQKSFRAKQVWDWLYKKRVKDFSEMRNVNKDCLQLLQEHFVIQSLSEQIKQQSADGTIKFLFKLPDGHMIETVLMRHHYGLSVCVTTQVGCNIGCTFCASGLLKKSRDLSSGEIVEQIIKVQQYLDQYEQGNRVSHVVVMGIGEPFDNYDHLMDFLRIINDQDGLAIGARRITVSTSGIVPKIYQFADANLQVNLAISLHAPNDELRTQIMKINRAYPLKELMRACQYYVAKTNRRITFEYILLKDVNDHEQEALQLADLIGDMRHLVYVNLIPYNPVAEHQQYQRSTPQAVQAFYETLKAKGINCGIRREHGTDIDAACGQLRSKQIKKNAALC